MRIQVKVVSRAKKPGVEQLIDGSWRVAVAAAYFMFRSQTG